MKPLSAVQFFVLALALMASIAYSQIPEGGGIVYGDELGVGVAAPAGWVFDSASGANQGLHAVMYPEGSTWSDATEVMYVNVARLDDDQSLEGFIDQAIAGLRNQSPELSVEAIDPIKMPAGEVAQVRLYSGDRWGNSEAVAYAEKDGSVAIYVLSCRTQSGFEKSLPEFKEMVGSSFLARMRFEGQDTSN